MFRYDIVKGQVRDWIAAGALKPGDRLLSVREMSAKLGFSTMTVHQAYVSLQDEGAIEARPRSGYFVAQFARPLPEFPSGPLDDLASEETPAADIEAHLLALRRIGRHEGLGSIEISSDLLAFDDLYRMMTAALRWESARHEQLPWQGLEALREAIGRRYGITGTAGRARDIIVTSSLEESIRTCLGLVAAPGSKVLVETPTDPACVSAVLAQGVNCVEIYSHPRSGIDPDQFQYLVENNDLAACILSPANHSPTGVSYSSDDARRIVEIAGRHRVPVIENVSGQDLLFSPPVCNLSQFDTRNLVIRVGNFGDTLGPRFGVGWIMMSARHRWKFSRSASENAGEWARQRAIAEFVTGRHYDRHLRKLREALSSRMHKGLSLMFEHFPDSCTVSRPSGGYLCWVRGPKDFNAIATALETSNRAPALAPGPMFSVSRAFGNFVAVNLSHAWTPAREIELVALGNLLASTHQETPGSPGNT